MELKLDTVATKLPELSEVSNFKADMEFSICSHDKFIISANAIFEGVGIAGLISAAFWYTTAPIAPDGFKGPISTYTITVTTIISLFLAIPIARYAYNKLIIDAKRLCSDLNAIIIEYLYSYNELIYDLLKLRSLFNSDKEFIEHLSSDSNNSFQESTLQLVCRQYQRLKNIHFNINWKRSKQLNSHEYLNDLDKLSFDEIWRNRDLSNSKSIRKMLIQFIQNDAIEDNANLNHIVEESLNKNQKIGRFKNTVFGIASGVACAEVLLSIGWTVISILIGIQAIIPISNLTWAIFAILCIVSGVVFGLGMGLSRHKQKKLQALYTKIKEENDLLLNLNDSLNHIISEHSFYLNWHKQSVKLSKNYDKTIKSPTM